MEKQINLGVLCVRFKFVCKVPCDPRLGTAKLKKSEFNVLFLLQSSRYKIL